MSSMQEQGDLWTKMCLQDLNLIKNKKNPVVEFSVRYFLVPAGEGGVVKCGPVWAHTCTYLHCVLRRWRLACGSVGLWYIQG